MKNNLQSAKDFLTKYRDERTHPVSVDYFAEMMVEYASSVRPEVVVPSEEKIIERCPDFYKITNGDFGNAATTMMEEAFISGGKWTKTELKRLNPTLTFTELNHTAPAGDKSDEG